MSGRILVCPHCLKLNRVPEARLAESPRCGSCHEPLFGGHPLELTPQTLQRFIAKEEIPLLVDFWAPWCAPCRVMAPAFEQAARELEPRVRLGKLDTEAHQQPVAEYGIRGIPTLILFAGGREKARVSGAMDAGQLRQWVSQQL